MVIFLDFVLIILTFLTSPWTTFLLGFILVVYVFCHFVPLLDVCDCLFSIFTATLNIWRLSLPSTTWGWWQKNPLVFLISCNKYKKILDLGCWHSSSTISLRIPWSLKIHFMSNCLFLFKTFQKWMMLKQLNSDLRG